MKSITSIMQQMLAERQSTGSKRSLPSLSLPFDFTSNDYLGLARSEELSGRIQERVEEIGGTAHGATGSRLLSGNSEFAMQLEAKLAGLFRAESGLLFNSGYVANLCLLACVGQKGDTILYDQLSHVCLKEGAWLSKASSFAFRHNDLDDLESRLSRADGNKFVVVESVYSMDGDTAPLAEICALCRRYEARLIVDEAHSTGIYGEAGNGIVCNLGLEDHFFARVYTFGKAMGVHGAVVVGNSELTEFLVNFGRGFIYTTAMPLHSMVAIEQAFVFRNEHPELADELERKITFFNQQYELRGSGFPKMPSNTAIQPLVVAGNQQAKQVAGSLQKKGFDVRPILAPTVRAGEERLRICLHTYNTDSEIENLCQTLSQLS